MNDQEKNNTENNLESQPKQKHLVFNLTGTFGGYGDVTGPLWTLIEMRSRDPDSNFTAILDDRSKKIIQDMYAGKSLSDMEGELGIKLVEKKDVKTIPIADYSFETFIGGRRIHDLTELVYTDKNTTTVISDTMHGNSFDEIRRPDIHSHIYFKPPGIGPNRSGIVSNPDISPFVGKTLIERKEIAANLFKDSPVEGIISGKTYPNVKIGFVYGTHNEFFQDTLVGQTKKYVEEAKKGQLKDHDRPTIIFSPNKQDLLVKAVSGVAPVLSLSDLETTKLENKLYVVSVGSVTNKQFTALMASSELPVLIEGNSSISSALKMQVPFLMMRSPWNNPQIKDIIELEKANCQSAFFEEIYDQTKGALPGLENKVRSKSDNSDKPSKFDVFDVFYGALSLRVPYLSKKFDAIVDLTEKLNDLETKAGKNNMPSSSLDMEYLKLSEDLLNKTRDEVLSYSVLFDAYKRGLISKSVLDQRKGDIEKLGYNVSEIEKKFVPNIPAFSVNYLAKEIKEKLKDSYSDQKEFVAACNKMMDMLDKLEQDNVITFHDELHLLRKTRDLVGDPTQYKDFLSEAKKHSAVAGGKLAAYIMLIAGWAAKIVTFGLTGQVWIDQATKKLAQIETVENLANEGKKHSNTPR